MNELRRMLMAIFGGVIPVPIESENVTITKETISFGEDTDFFYWWENNLTLQKGITIIIDSTLLARSGYTVAQGKLACATLRWNGNSQSGTRLAGDGRPGYGSCAIIPHIIINGTGMQAINPPTCTGITYATDYRHGYQINSDGSIVFSPTLTPSVVYENQNHPYFLANLDYYIFRIPSNLVY